jgi:prophage regulatory protein
MNETSKALFKKILRLKELTCIVGLSRSSIYRLVSLGMFPAPIKIGVSAVGWDSADIDSWLTERKLSGNR